jgi:beta-hydroxyacyl-ACP dehydratase FabZ
MMEIGAILDILPHRYPFLLVDRILEVEKGKRAVGLKNVTVNEPFFQGHFPGRPIMPGVLILEAMAQVGGILLLHDIEDRHEKLIYFTGIDHAKFRRPVVPGDQLRMEVEILKLRSWTCKLRASATVEGQLAAEAEILSAMVDRGAGR